MRIRTDLYPEQHQSYYRLRFGKSSEVEVPSRTPRGAVRLSRITILRVRGLRLDDIRRNEDLFTEDERSVVDYIQASGKCGDEAIDLLIDILNQNIALTSHSRLSLELVLCASPTDLAVLVERFFKDSDLQVEATEPLSVGDWILGTEMHDDEARMRISSNANSCEATVSVLQLFTMIKQTRSGSGHQVNRFRIPANISPSAWFAFWALLHSLSLVKGSDTNGYWRALGLHFFGVQMEEVGITNLESIKVSAHDYLSRMDEGTLRELRILAETVERSEDKEAMNHSGRAYSLRNQLFFRFYGDEIARGKEAVFRGTPWDWNIQLEPRTREYTQWKKAFLIEQFTRLGVAEEDAAVMTRFATGHEEWLPVPLCLVDRVLRFLQQCTELRKACQVISIILKHSKRDDEAAFVIYQLLPGYCKFPVKGLSGPLASVVEGY